MMSLSPYRGYAVAISNYFKRVERQANIPFFYEQQGDFDADAVKPTEVDEDYIDDLDSEEEMNYVRNLSGENVGARVFDPYTDTIEKFDVYERHLEDIHPAYVYKYLENLKYSIVTYKQHGVLEHNANHKLQNCLYDEENEHAISQADLLMLNGSESHTEAELSYAESRLPYVLKRLNNLSILMGVHMLSYISAYIRAESEYNVMRSNGSKSAFKYTNVINAGFYMCDSAGNPTKLATISMKNPKTSEVFSWYIGDSNKWRAYWKDVTNYITYANLLNIDIINDDMSKYDCKFFKKLKVTMLTPDSQYNPEVYNRLLKGNVKPTQQDDILNAINAFRDLVNTNADMRSRSFDMDEHNRNVLKSYLIMLYVRYRNTQRLQTNPDKLAFTDGVLCYDNSVARIPSAFFMSQKDKSRPCIMHELGYFISLDTSNGVEYIESHKAYNNYVTKNDQYADRRSYDSWNRE